MSVHRILQNGSRFSSLLVNRMATGRVLAQKQPAAFISTSKKNRDTTITTDPASFTAPKTVEDFANVSTKKNYQGFGFDNDDPDMDINIRNYVMFTSVTIGLVGVGFVMMYFPDHRLRDWTQREAYIELARREALGLPAVDPNYVPPETVHLPSEEELADFDIII